MKISRIGRQDLLTTTFIKVTHQLTGYSARNGAILLGCIFVGTIILTVLSQPASSKSYDSGQVLGINTTVSPIEVPTPTLEPTSPPPSPSPSSQTNTQKTVKKSTVFECKGPDGVIFKTTANECSKLNRYWHNVNAGKETSNTDDPIKLNDTITEISTFGADRMATRDEVFAQMNAYRTSRGIRALETSVTLCTIAQKRAGEVNGAGQIDHSGFDQYANNQQEFNYMGEVLMTGEGPSSAVQIVDEGWARSLTGHKEAIEDGSWTNGCAGISGNTATFIFGTK